MSRFVLVVIVFLALAGAAFFGYELTRDHEATFSPELIFGPEDESVLLINRIDELNRYNQLSKVEQNPIAKELNSIDLSKYSSLKIFVSGTRPVVIFKKNSRWSKKDISYFEINFKNTQTKVDAKGDYLVVYHDDLKVMKGFEKGYFIEGDKKASGSLWRFRGDYEDWVRTDVYASEKGLFNYKTENKYKTQGPAIPEQEKFTSVVPENIQKYEFFERFYAAEKDTIFASGLMNEWVDQGYVNATFNDEVFLITDNRKQQTPSLILLEQSSNEDSIDYTSTIKFFQGFQLTRDFPTGEEQRVFLLELEDKTIITETKALAQKIQLLYNLGETIALNTKKSEQFFGDLPKSVNYRFIDKSHKKSITVSDQIIFEVSTLPPGEQMIMQEVSNWSKSLGLNDIAGVTPIKDHIRGGYSLFTYNHRGAYELLNTNGESVFKGILDTSIIGKPTVIDLYSNDKKQLLFTTSKSIHLLDLNGNQVGRFPYKSHHPISSPPSTYTWKGTVRFLFATTNGELITVNNSGQELNAIQATRGAIYEKPYALNVDGNLRAWFKNESNNTGLAYLEKPIASEVIGKSKSTTFYKSTGSIDGWFFEDDAVFKESMNNPEVLAPFGEGKLISVSKDHVILQKQNELFIYSHKGDVINTQKLPFNEVADANTYYYNGQLYLGVFDFLENNFYLYADDKLVDGFPKESRRFTKGIVDKQEGIFLLFTQINENIICYKHKLN